MGHQAAALGQANGCFPLSNKAPCNPVATQPQEGEDGDAVARRGSLQIPRPSLGTLGWGWEVQGSACSGPCPARPPPHHHRCQLQGQLVGRLRPNPLQLPPEASEHSAQAGEGRRDPGSLPIPDPASALRLRTSLFRKQGGLPGAHHVPLRWLQPFSSYDPVGGRAPFCEGGPLAD